MASRAAALRPARINRSAASNARGHLNSRRAPAPPRPDVPCGAERFSQLKQCVILVLRGRLLRPQARRRPPDTASTIEQPTIDGITPPHSDAPFSRLLPRPLLSYARLAAEAEPAGRTALARRDRPASFVRAQAANPEALRPPPRRTDASTEQPSIEGRRYCYIKPGCRLGADRQ